MVTFVRGVQDPRFGSSALDRALDAGKEGSRLLLVDDHALSILDGYKLILTSLLAPMGISTNHQRIYFFAGYLRLAMHGVQPNTTRGVS